MLVGLRQASTADEARDLVEALKLSPKAPEEKKTFLVPAVELLTDAVLLGDGVRSGVVKGVVVVGHATQATDDAAAELAAKLTALADDFNVTLFREHAGALTDALVRTVGAGLCEKAEELTTPAPPTTTGECTGRQMYVWCRGEI